MRLATKFAAVAVASPFVLVTWMALFEVFTLMQLTFMIALLILIVVLFRG